MSDAAEARRLALAWIEGWQAGDPDSIPLAEDFVHTSPFGRLEGRQHYLATVKPMSRQNVASLTVRSTLAEPGQAVVRFDMETAHGTIPVCDWVWIAEGEIRAIHSFYDATDLRSGGSS
ncbi:MAG: nuclear transport factor 2 family protein [Acidobacteriota bacterium]